MLRRALSSAIVGAAAVAALAVGGGAANAAPDPSPAPAPNAAAASCGWYTQSNWLGQVSSWYNHCAGWRQLIHVNTANGGFYYECMAPWQNTQLGPYSVVTYAYAVSGPC
ncbi:DUF6355 family natural product biosynthesis protein [Rhodococcus erythropolis]